MGTAAHTTSLTVKLSTHELETLDRLRGGLGRSTYMRRLLARAEGQQVAQTTNTKPTVRSSPSSPPPAPASPEFRKPERHLHRYKRTGDPVRHLAGVPFYRYTCDCGATREDR